MTEVCQLKIAAVDTVRLTAESAKAVKFDQFQWSNTHSIKPNQFK